MGAAVGVDDGGAVLGGGDGDAVGVVVMLGLAGIAVIVGDGADVAPTGGGAHDSASAAARTMRRGAMAGRRVLCSLF